MLCLNQLPTLCRLHSFGIDIETSCFLCAGGHEIVDHLFVHCSLSNYILRGVCSKIHTCIQGTNWLELLHFWGSISHHGHRNLALLAGQVFSYHIWRECNARLHNKGILGPSKIILVICIDVKARIVTLDG